MSLKELRRYSGDEPSLPKLISLKGQVFNVSDDRDVFGKEPLSHCCGHDASRVFAVGGFSAELLDQGTEGLNQAELQRLEASLRMLVQYLPLVARLAEDDMRRLFFSPAVEGSAGEFSAQEQAEG